MSRFIDRLKRVSQGAAQPMGFRMVSSAARPRLSLVAHLAQPGIANIADYVAGADAGLISIARAGSGVKALKELGRSLADIVWGGWLGDTSREEIEQIVAAGGDFVVLPVASSSLAVLEADDLGKILAVEASLDEGLLKAVNRLPVDAVLVVAEPEEEPPLTWRRLMSLQRLADILAKPLLVSIPSEVTADELQVLWETGVDGLVVEVEAGQPAARLGELRQMIDRLPPPSRGRRERKEALIPRITGEAELATEEEDEA